MKIYTWQYQGKTGIVYADNMKAARQELAVKQGNDKKIKKGTKIKKTGLCKNKPPRIVTVAPEETVSAKPVPQEIVQGNKQTKATKLIGPATFKVNGGFVYIGPDCSYVVNKGDMLEELAN